MTRNQDQFLNSGRSTISEEMNVPNKDDLELNILNTALVSAFKTVEEK